jgi:hypothetical protein
MISLDHSHVASNYTKFDGHYYSLLYFKTWLEHIIIHGTLYEQMTYFEINDLWT